MIGPTKPSGVVFRNVCILLIAPSDNGPRIPSSGPLLNPKRLRCAWRIVAWVTVVPVYELNCPLRDGAFRFWVSVCSREQVVVCCVGVVSCTSSPLASLNFVWSSVRALPVSRFDEEREREADSII